MGKVIAVQVRTPATGIRPIIPWSGSIGAIPAGWDLCDGSNGTPDLRDRFILGHDLFGPIAYGGTLMPVDLVHTHGITPGSYVDYLVVGTGTAHLHDIVKEKTPSTFATGVSGLGVVPLSVGKMPHDHGDGNPSPGMPPGGDHSHPLKGTLSEAATLPIDFRQPFLALAYIKSRGLVELPLHCIAAVDSAAYPPSYHVCNGSGGTPNFRGRFVIGAGSFLAAGAASADPDTAWYTHDHGSEFFLPSSDHGHEYSGAPTFSADHTAPYAPDANGTGGGVGLALLGSHSHTLAIRADTTTIPLTAPMSPTDMTATVAYGYPTAVPTTRYNHLVDAEIIGFTGCVSPTWTVVERGVDLTTPAAHASGAQAGMVHGHPITGRVKETIIGIDVTPLCCELDFVMKTSGSGGAHLPIGAIVNYSGSLGSLPSGWALYGLSDQSVLGAGGLSAVGDTGGSFTQTYPAHAHGPGDLLNYIITSPVGGGRALNAHPHQYPYEFLTSSDDAVDLSNGSVSTSFLVPGVDGHGHKGTLDTSAVFNELEWLFNANYHTHDVAGSTAASSDIPSAYLHALVGSYFIVRVS